MPLEWIDVIGIAIACFGLGLCFGHSLGSRYG